MIRTQRWIWCDNFRRFLFVKFEIKKILLASLTKNTYLPRSYAYLSQYEKSKLVRFSSYVSQRNRCFISGRVRAVFNKTATSRFILRKQSYRGDLPGCKRASW